MSLLYKEPHEVITSVDIEDRCNEGKVKMTFWNDGGKFGTHEILDGYNLTPERLLEILQDRDDYTEEELNI